MATRHSTGSVPAFLLSKPVPIQPATIRGQLCYVVGNVAFAGLLNAILDDVIEDRLGQLEGGAS